MAGSIRTNPVTREYEENFDRSMRRGGRAMDRPRRPHECELCGRVMEYADQQCGCSARSNKSPRV